MHSDKELIYHKEKFYFVILIVVSLLVYLAFIISIVGIVILALFIVLYWFIHNLTLVNIRKNGVKISEMQFPSFYAKAVNVAQQMNMKDVPDIYVIQSGGILNAFATKFGLRNMVVLYSDIFALIEEQEETEVLYILAHEFAHIKRKHVGYGWLLMPGLALPFLGNAYSRACEFTCDRYGAYYSQSYESAKNALTILAVGPQLYKHVDQAVFTQQIASESGAFSWLDEIMSTHPNLPRRIHALDLFFNREQTDIIKTSKKGVVLGSGLLILGCVLTVFSMFWFTKQIGDSLLLGNDLYTDDYTYGYDEESMNPLMHAVLANDLEQVKEHASNEMLNEQNADGYTALHFAVLTSNYDAAVYLLEQGADPNSVDYYYEYTPLMDAVTFESYELTELLLQFDADKTFKTSEGYDAYTLATDYEYNDIAKLLE